jgi:hypothetical protein
MPDPGFVQICIIVEKRDERRLRLKPTEACVRQVYDIIFAIRYIAEREGGARAISAAGPGIFGFWHRGPPLHLCDIAKKIERPGSKKRSP